MMAGAFTRTYPHLSDFDFVSEEIKWSQIFHQLTGFKYLGANWDGENAEPPSWELIESLSNFLKSIRQQQILPAPERVLATQDGSVIVEWQLSDHLLELETDAPGRGELMTTIVNGESSFREIVWEQSTAIEYRDSTSTSQSPYNTFWTNVA